MSLTWESIQGNAIAFVTRWKDASNEEAQAQSFTTDFLKVFGIDDPEKTGDFEYKVSLMKGVQDTLIIFGRRNLPLK